MRTQEREVVQSLHKILEQAQQVNNFPNPQVRTRFCHVCQMSLPVTAKCYEGVST